MHPPYSPMPTSAYVDVSLLRKNPVRLEILYENELYKSLKFLVLCRTVREFFKARNPLHN
jgi:hypothetical protein